MERPRSYMPKISPNLAYCVFVNPAPPYSGSTSRPKAPEKSQSQSHQQIATPTQLFQLAVNLFRNAGGLVILHSVVDVAKKVLRRSDQQLQSLLLVGREHVGIGKHLRRGGV